MKLNARQVDAAKPREKAYKLADGAGLYLEVVPSGSRYWRMKYRFNGKEKRMAFGVYPTVSLAQARALRDEAKKSWPRASIRLSPKKKKSWFAMCSSTTHFRLWRLNGTERR